ncbi:Fc.00g109420.m01.CDS01 [Cosmosporella sp. VM-42]
MAVLGKRKAPEPSVSEEEAAAIFRRHFESRFGPLPELQTKTAEAQDDEEDDDTEEGEEDENEEWGGLSDDGNGEYADDVPTVEIVDHSISQPPKPTTMSKREFKAFMSSRPVDPTATPSTTTQQPTVSKTTLPEDAPSLLKQDLELRRLLSESHLLAPALTAAGTAVAPKAFAAGRTRHKATDLRVQALGSKTSIHKQEKMPMNMRKGIVAAAGARESKRRREAKENGVILERETGRKKTRDRGRDLGVDRPGVGRLKGAELRISDRDVKKIEGGRDAFGRRSKR